ncbi:MAG TPA: CaiB/BaiF CoA-transferase family protein [Hyphomicrobiaceae bacterium]|nr:CaiB/BaiF CoA-transferase family protein [Hyphomicrobiaceae bacterium]
MGARASEGRQRMGPLKGFRVIEMAGIGPAPFCAMMLADMGAEVIRVDRREKADLGLDRAPAYEVMNRGRKTIAVDIKKPEAVEIVKRLVGDADALIEGFRPGVMERLGLGPEELAKVNPRLVFGRMTGFGQEGPLAARAGHDINYIALAGVLSHLGRAGERPVHPLNLVGDFGGGGMYLAFGVVCAMLEAQRSGKGQVVDAAMVDGAASLMAMFHGMWSEGIWREERGTNMLDTGAPWYDVYETKDGKFVSIGSIEGRFYADLIGRLGLTNEALPKQHDRAGWPVLRARFTEIFKSKTRSEWEKVFEGSDACFAPVLSISEVTQHPHNAVRSTFIKRDGVQQPAPAPRFSRTRPELGGPSKPPGTDTADVLALAGYTAADIERLMREGVAGAA